MNTVPVQSREIIDISGFSLDWQDRSLIIHDGGHLGEPDEACRHVDHKLSQLGIKGHLWDISLDNSFYDIIVVNFLDDEVLTLAKIAL